MFRQPAALLLCLPLFAIGACARGSDGIGGDSGTLRIDASVAPGADSGTLPGTDATVPPGTDGGPTAEIDGGGLPIPDAGIVPGVDGGSVPPIDGGPGDRCAGVMCPATGSPCTMSACDPATGTCAISPRTDGTTCDDGNLCTTGDACAGGTCAAGAAVDCSAMTTACGTGMCAPATGTCTMMAMPEGTACGTPSGCTSSTCRTGACVSAPSADCAACGSGMYCSAGTCGASPTTLSYGFESGALPVAWMNGIGGTAPWTFEGTGAHSGTYRARSGAIGHSAQSRMGFTITLATAASLSFWLTTSTETCCDHLELYVDGTRVGQWQGTTAWTEASVNLAAGTRTIEWRYAKDGSVVTGMDAVWIDDVRIGAPTSANTGFESAALPAGWTTSGSPAWFVDTTMPHGGTRAAGSGAIGHSGTTSLTRMVTVPSATTLTFWYRVSTEASFDYLRVFIDGTMQGQWSGTVAWTMASYPLAAGAHTVEWRYTKDGSVVAGSDRVWIDDVDFGMAGTGGPLCGP